MKLRDIKNLENFVTAGARAAAAGKDLKTATAIYKTAETTMEAVLAEVTIEEEPVIEMAEDQSETAQEPVIEMAKKK